MIGAESQLTQREIIRNYLQSQPNLVDVDAKEAAQYLNREFGLRGNNRIEAQSVVAHKAVLNRESNQASGEETVKLDASQRRLITNLLKGEEPADVIRMLRAWEKRIEEAGSLDKAINRLTQEATLISSLGDSPANAIAAVKKQAGK